MIDLHTHTVLSDGVLLPTELIRRCEAKGYRCLVVADHVDTGTAEQVIPVLVKVCNDVRATTKMKLKPGAELTHVRPEHYADLVRQVRDLGAEVVLAHGETIVEPVIAGTNRAAIEAGADVLAHPGLITKEDAALAAERGVCLEISGRRGHSLTNGHVAKLALEVGADLVFGTDTHTPDDLVARVMAETIARGAGLSVADTKRLFVRAEGFFE
ncbi:MAG: histidinol phosphate phosphatase domain-containing protein [Planctomycetota bacterium]